MNLDDEPVRERHIQIYEADRKVPRDTTKTEPANGSVRAAIVAMLTLHPRLQDVDRIHGLIRSSGRNDVRKTEIRYVMAEIGRPMADGSTVASGRGRPSAGSGSRP